MPTAVLITPTKSSPRALPRDVSVTKTITHNSQRLYHEGGATYEFVGTNGSGDRIYRNVKKVR